MSIKQPEQEQRHKPARKYRIRSLRSQLIKPYGQTTCVAVEKNGEIDVDYETQIFLCGSGSGLRLAVLIGEV